MSDEIGIPRFSSSELLEGGDKFKLPKIVPIAQKFACPIIDDLEKSLCDELNSSNITDILSPGSQVAVAVGSRGITNLELIIKIIVQWLKSKGLKPFIVPAMGSHGGPTPEGQAEILADYGIDEESSGAKVISSLEVDSLGYTSSHLPVWVDSVANSSDGVIVVNRIKPHTDFHGEIESGLLKMLAVGLGKHRGASVLHSAGFDKLGQSIIDTAQVILNKVPILGGVAIVENAYKKTAVVKYVRKETMIEDEKKILIQARKLMPSIPLEKIDFLLVQQVGKDVSGAGFDPNIIGRRKIWGVSDLDIPKVSVMAVLELTPGTHGNASGIAIADLIPKRILNDIDWKSTYASLVTATIPQHAHIPMVLNTDLDVLKVGAKIASYENPTNIKLCWILNTSYINKLWVSEAAIQDLKEDQKIEILGEAQEFQFSQQGQLEWVAP